MSRVEELYAELCQKLREASVLGSCGSLLSWDEQTYMPTGGGEHRANQLGMLAGLTHERSTAPRIGELLAELEQSDELGDPDHHSDSDRAANVREARRAYDRVTKLPRKLVEEISRTTSLAHRPWVEARKSAQFSTFLPWLEKMIGLKREEAAAIGSPTGVLYDALLDDYEAGATTAEIASVFRPLRTELVKLVREIEAAPRKPDESIITRRYPKSAQQEFAKAAAVKIGFNFERGRLDETAHPFCSGIGPGDCRLTTRYDEHHFPGAFFGVLHEAGHGIYEQGLLDEHFGTPLGQAASLGIHESQSRMWENLVGRSRAFWDGLYPAAQTAYPEALGNVTLGDFHFAINTVQPSFIRVEADEVTYNLHIMLRFELEQQLVSGALKPRDVPAVWNATFEEFFQRTPPDDSQGCLQDIHWSAGLLGYFPTYALGNIYAAQFFEAAAAELGDLPAQFARGEFQPLKDWLNRKIHRHGKRYLPRRLLEVVTGKTLSAEPLLRQLRAKYAPLYGFSS